MGQPPGQFSQFASRRPHACWINGLVLGPGGALETCLPVIHLTACSFPDAVLPAVCDALLKSILHVLNNCLSHMNTSNLCNHVWASVGHINSGLLLGECHQGLVRFVQSLLFKVFNIQRSHCFPSGRFIVCFLLEVPPCETL